MLKFIFILSLAILLVPSTYGQEKKQIKWHINYNKVTELAKKENKLVLMLFHGSNWCPPCIKMQNEVFAADTFISNVSEKILFLDIDFRTNPKLSEAQLTHNKEVKKRFSLPDDFSQGYPQVIIINGKGEVQYQEKGYDGRGPAYLMGKIDNLLKSKYLKKAKKLLPELSHQTSYPTRSIKIEKDVQVWLGWKAKIVSSVDELAKVKLIKGDTLILDFGRNMVGYLQGFSTGRAKMQIEPAEVLAELGDSWEKFPASFDNGFKPTRTWSPKVLDIQNNWRCSERLTFRYVRLVILEATDEIVLSKLNCDEVSAVPLSKIKPLEGFSPKMQQIDLAAQYTLRNCIQEVFEDGPKRDQRLWLGDLRLQAMLDALTFKSDSIVKRSILLFAGTQREDGFISSCVYNTSTGGNPAIGDEMIPDYAMLFGSTLLNYAKSSNDLKLAKALYPIACQQVDLACSKWLSTGNYLEIPNNIWMLIDWSKELDRQAAEQATLIYAINTLSELANMIGLPKDANKWVELNKKLKVAAIEKYFYKQKGLFVSGPQHQVSWATQIWMVLAGVVDKNEGARILKNVAADASAIKPGCPYLVHHLVEAYLICDMDKEAYQLIDTYWGGMIDKGATTFWEIYDPENAYKSPYNSHLFNSYCHAWSCTPAWFLRHPVYGKRLKKIDIIGQTLPGSYTTSWAGNTFAPSTLKYNFVQNWANSMFVDADGTIFSNSFWDEAAKELGIYKNGQCAGMIPNQHGHADGGGITANNTFIWATAHKGKISRFNKTNYAENGTEFTASTATIKGLVANETELFVSDYADGKIKVYSAATQASLLRSWSVNRPGPLAMDALGNIWVLTYDANAWGPGTGSCIKAYSPTGSLLKTLTLATGVEAKSIAIDRSNNELLVTDIGVNMQIHIYNIINDTPALMRSFGTQGGILSGTKGLVAPLKLNVPNLVGVDASHNIIIWSNGNNTDIDKKIDADGMGSCVESYSRAGSRNWQLLGLEFVDMGTFDPSTDGADLYTKHEHFTMDYSKPDGQQWTWKGWTLDRINYANSDIRTKNGGGHLASPMMRRINGNLFMYLNSMSGGGFSFFRFTPDNEISIPCGEIFGKSQWNDMNANGQKDTGETSSNVLWQYDMFGNYVDNKGDIWYVYDDIKKHTLQSITNGVPVYNLIPTIITTPAPFNSLRRIQYDSDNDIMYLSGYTAAKPYTNDWKSCGLVLARYNNWSTGNRIAAYSINLPTLAADVSNMVSLAVEKDYIFVVGVQTRAKVWVYNSLTGALVGTMVPGANVGGIEKTGWCDIVNSISAFKTSSGQYLVTVEDDGWAKILIYRWCPTGECKETGK